MKHIFIINPMAGSGKLLDETRKKIENSGLDYLIYETKAPKDATAFVRDYCTSHPSEELRFYACGGDGTANEVATGTVGFENASFTCYPIGSGNDFVKYYGGADSFLDLAALASAPARPVDILAVDDDYSINVLNFGFDATVGSTMQKVKRKPIIGGKHAYTTGIATAIFTAMKTRGKLVGDGNLLFDGKFLLCTVSNGAFVGGSFHCAPRAVNDDGYMEFCLLRPVSLPRFLSILDPYQKGLHLQDPRFADILTYCRVKTLEVTFDKPQPICLDGEIKTVTSFTVKCLPGALRFAAPEGAKLHEEPVLEPAKA